LLRGEVVHLRLGQLAHLAIDVSATMCRASERRWSTLL
jgi:hypothetical protein